MPVGPVSGFGYKVGGASAYGEGRGALVFASSWIDETADGGLGAAASQPEQTNKEQQHIMYKKTKKTKQTKRDKSWKSRHFIVYTHRYSLLSAL